MITLSAGPDGVVQPGTVVNVSSKEGQELIDGRYAVKYVDPKVEAKAKAKASKPPAKETAMIDPPESPESPQIEEGSSEAEELLAQAKKKSKAKGKKKKKSKTKK